jgi:CelD/BcsL family acetyltransferase involved in cellulose biosynthesis
MSRIWAESWWMTLRRQSPWVNDSLRLYSVRDESGALIAIAPMMLTARTAAGIAFARTLQFIGADPNITEVRGPLVAPDDEKRVTEALATHLAQTPGYDRLLWHGLRAGGAAAASMRAMPGAVEGYATPMFTVTLPDSWETFKRALPRNTREALRKCYNSLARDGHSYEFRSLETADAIGGSLDLFVRLHSQRAELTDTVRHRDCFATQQAQAFLRTLTERLAPTGVMRMFQLEVDEQVVAMRLAFLYDGGVYLYYSGYDPAWSRYSVMTTLVAEALKHGIASGFRFANLSTGVDRSKLRWRPEESQFASVVLTRATPRAKLAARVESLTVGARAMRDRLLRSAQVLTTARETQKPARPAAEVEE